MQKPDGFRSCWISRGSAYGSTTVGVSYTCLMRESNGYIIDLLDTGQKN